MCGRLACGLEPKEIKNCCRYREHTNSEFFIPIWRSSYNLGKTYKPSYNICPSEVAPVLLSGFHFNSDVRTIAPMIFGLIPSWIKNVDASSKYSTINCRIENIKSSKLYGPLLKKGQRCIVVCNGFFEWKKEGRQGSKPYFIHMKQEDDISLCDPGSWNLNSPSNQECKSLKLLRIAALFEKQIQEDSNNEILSFTILTKESSVKMSWLHHRMPAIIDTEEQLEIWLNSEKYDENQALESLSHFENVLYYPVSAAVSTTSNKTIICVKPNERSPQIEKQNQASSSLLKNWLKKRSASAESDKCEEESKKAKN